MNCVICKVSKISPRTPPFGGYVCRNDHLQCRRCNERNAGRCGFCKKRTDFMQLKFSKTFSSSTDSDLDPDENMQEDFERRDTASSISAFTESEPTEVEPFGVYVCRNDHLQCQRCNERNAGRCGFCKKRTDFMQLKFSKTFSSSTDSDLDPDENMQELSLVSGRVRVFKEQNCLQDFERRDTASSISAFTESEPTELEPFGVYVCRNDHLQCQRCNERNAGRCGFCKKRTDFMQLKFSKTFSSSTDSDLDPDENMQEDFERRDTASSISAFTESEPTELEPIESEYMDPNYLVMQATVTADASTQTVTSSNTCRCAAEHSASRPEKPNEGISNQHSNSYRTCNHPFIPHTAAHSGRSYPVDPPPQLITRPTLVASKYPLSRQSHLLTESLLASLSIPWLPMRCPVYTCKREVPLSGFGNHMASAHTNVPMRIISPGMYEKFFLDPGVARVGIHKVHRLFLAGGSMSAPFSNKFKDYQPLVVVSTYMRQTDLCSCRKGYSGDDDLILVIWLASFLPLDVPVDASLGALMYSGGEPTFHKVYTGNVYPSWNLQKLMLLRGVQVTPLMEVPKDKLQLQLSVRKQH